MAPTPLTYAQRRHLTARLGFGLPTHHEVDALRGMSRDAALSALLDGARAANVRDAPSWVAERPLVLELREMRRMAKDDGAAAKKARALFRQKLRPRAIELRAWWIEQMLATSSPLMERMVLFWHNHFTSALRKVRSPVLMWRQHLTLRRYALGSFRDMLAAIARDPAMLIYLDNVSNRRRKPNENFAREVMELFTLGEGHYTEADIKEAARAFAGWSLHPQDATFRVAPFGRDVGEKTVLGQRGAWDGDDVVRILLEQKVTARWIVGKLWDEFAATPRNEAEIARIAARFRDANYDIPTALRAVCSSDHFWAKEAQGARIKSPVDLLVGTVRFFKVDLPSTNPLLAGTRRLGHDLFNPPNVKGWAGGEQWITSDTLMMRQQMLTRVFRDPGNMPEIARHGFAHLLGEEPTSTSHARRILARQMLPLTPVYPAPETLGDDAFALARHFALDPTFQLC